MKKIPLAIVVVVALFSLFTLFRFFNTVPAQTAPSALATYYSPRGLEVCTLPVPDVALPYNLCVRQGVDNCKSMYFAEPQIMTGWDPCYKVCVHYIYNACLV
ncbi:hypothetical protein DRJ22_00545 [Candidatus Woesearchaeota archaeon]|nr:MAG: hypothetical protein B6U93_00200 [Candidatus Woesearchaeota archaeon ex4484_78]RLE46981.1 MAG: hypothetical protein DRJ22_00545 [Candidatus Woesearchaeota archaeon]